MSCSSRFDSCGKEVVGIMIPEEIQRLLEDVEGYLADGLQNENLSAKARDQRDAILFGFQQVKARYHLDFLPRGEDQHDAGFGQDSSDENQTWSLAPSMTSDASFPSDFQDDGLGANVDAHPSSTVASGELGLQELSFCGCGDAFEDVDQPSTLPQPQGGPREWDLRPCMSLGLEETGPRGSGGTKPGVKE
ncbi:src kinase-associated phosphoprotein 1 [Grus japonensis]|uniref:Src kinase-associated phosphoprotein 1 n=1 Tax=Grus japonensis TaxID=30415 RepID=A0ABC9XPQ1_GRUJA